MLETIFDLLDGLWTDFKTLMSPIIKVGLWVSGLGLIFALIPMVSAGLDTLHTYLAAALSWTQSNGFDTYYAKVNSIVPLTETLAMLATLLAYQAAMAGIRIIKSFVPTVS